MASPAVTPSADTPAEGGTGLFKLPPELRNYIYELAFFTPCSEYMVDVFEAKPPCNSLLATCKAIFDEAEGIFKAANHEYWTTEHFQVVYDNGLEKTAIKQKNLQLVRHITFMIGSEELADAAECRIYPDPWYLVNSDLPLVFRRHADGNWWLADQDGKVWKDDRSKWPRLVVDIAKDRYWLETGDIKGTRKGALNVRMEELAVLLHEELP
jgi:hypothetical protein